MRWEAMPESGPWRKRVNIGDAVLLLGDCVEIMPVLQEADVVITDPPYGMGFQSNYRVEQHQRIVNDDNAGLLVWACGIPVRHSRYVFCRWDNLQDGVPRPKSYITWVKNNWSMGDLEHEHARQTEVAMFWPGFEHSWPSGRPTDVVMAPRTGNSEHPTEKPVYLMEQFIRWTQGVVLDPFMGSGTTGVACTNLGRKFIGIEVEEKYFNISCERIASAYAQGRLFA